MKQEPRDWSERPPRRYPWEIPPRPAVPRPEWATRTLSFPRRELASPIGAPKLPAYKLEGLVSEVMDNKPTGTNFTPLPFHVRPGHQNGKPRLTGARDLSLVRAGYRGRGMTGREDSLFGNTPRLANPVLSPETAAKLTGKLYQARAACKACGAFGFVGARGLCFVCDYLHGDRPPAA